MSAILKFNLQDNGDRTFSRQSNRTFKSQSLINKDRTSKNNRTFKSQSDRTFKV